MIIRNLIQQKDICKSFSRLYVTKSAEQSVSYCLHTIKNRDYENYLCTLLLPSKIRLVGITARAFNVELALIQESTTESQIAKMRTEFWRRSLDETFDGKPPKHPVFLAMANCLCEKNMSKKYFTRMIDIRERYINTKQFMSLCDVEDYGEYTASSVIYLLIERLDLSDNYDITHIASHLGKATSLVTLIRSVPYFITKRSVVLPTEILVKHGLSNEDIIRKENEDKVADVIYDIASQAFVHLEHAQNILNKQNIKGNSIFLPLISCKSYLEKLQKMNFDIYNVNVHKKNWTLAIRLLLAHWRNKF